MTDSNYPSSLDTDLELPRVDDNITEIGGEAINGLRSAVFNIEETLGIDPHGTAADLATRLNQSLNPDGTIKASALATIGLVTLPIYNSQIASNAGIEESKLDLDHGTVLLKTWIDELRVWLTSLNDKVIIDIFNLSQHTAHPSNYGRHWTQDIDGYTGKYASYNLQGVITDLDTRLIDHITDLVDAHDASAISVDDSLLAFTAADVQAAIEALNEIGISSTILHRDNQHSNGILETQRTFYDGYAHGSTIVETSALNTVSVGANSIQFSSSPSGLSEVLRGDLIEVNTGSQKYYFDVESADTSTDTVTFFGRMPASSIGATAAIYKTTEEKYTPSNLKLAIRQASISSIGGSVIQIVHPNAPFILSNGIDLRDLSVTEKMIKIGWEGGQTEEIDAYQLMSVFPVAGQPPSTWTPENFAIALNELFKADYAPAGYAAGSSYPYHYPLIAFEHNGEVGIAYDEPDGYAEILAPSTNSAWSILGFSEGERVYGVGPRRFYIDGYEFSSIRTIVDTTGRTQIGFNGVRNIVTDLSPFGFDNGGLVRLKNSSDDGTYVFNSATSDTLTINEHTTFSTDNDVNIVIYADYFVVPTIPSNRTLYDLFIDGYNSGQGAELKGTKRLEYNFAAGSTNNPQRWFDIIDISRNFRNSEKRINYQLDGSDRVVIFGDRGTGLDVDDSGTRYVLPTSNVEGHRFKLHDSNGIDYIELEIADSAFLSVGVENAIDIDIYDRISEDKYAHVGRLLHNKTDGFRHLSDRRLFGTVGRKDVKDDYTRDYVSYPTSLLRGNGVIYGFSVFNATTEIDAYGGEVLVNGTIYALSRTTFTIPKDGAPSTYNLFVDDAGVFQFLKDNQFVSGQIVTLSLEEIIASSDKTMIAQVSVDAANNITGIADYRRFVGKIDDRIELLIEENTITHGSFASLSTALRYLSALGDLPAQKVIRIRGTVMHDVTDGSVALPDGVTLVGDNGLHSGSGTVSKILLHGTAPTDDAFLTVGENCALRNIIIEVESGSTVDSLIGKSTLDINGLELKNCIFKNIYGKYIIRANDISNCVISNCRVIFAAVTGYDNHGIKAHGDVNNTIIDNCDFTLSSTTSLNTGLWILGTATNTKVHGCLFSFSTTSSINICIYVLNLYESEIRGCSIDAPTVSATNVCAMFGSEIKKCIIKDCIVNNFNAGFVLTGGFEDTTVSGNIFTECANFVLDGASSYRSIFDGNSIVNATLQHSTLFDFFNGSESLTISNNFASLASTTSGGHFAKVCSCENVRIINNAYNVTGAITAGAIETYGDSIYIRGNSFKLSGASAEIINISSTSTNVQFMDNSIISTASVVCAIDFGNAITNAWIKNNTIDLVGASANAIYFANDAYNVVLKDNMLNSTDTISGVLVVFEKDAYGISIENNINRVTTVGWGWLKFADPVKDLNVDGNVITATGTANRGLYFEDKVDNVRICNNRFENDGNIYIFAEFKSSIMGKNIFICNNDVNADAASSYPLIDLRSGPGVTRDAFIIGNKFLLRGQGFRMVCANGVSNIHVIDNQFESQYTGAGYGYMIEIYNGMSNVNVSKNILKNTGGSATGFTNGIKVDGDSLVGENVTVSNNIIDGFNSSGGWGIRVRKMTSGIIDGNVVTDAHEAFQMYSCSQLVISGNHFESSTANMAVRIEGTTSDKFIIFNNNYVLGSSASTLANNLIQITGGVSNILVNNNIFELRSEGTGINYYPMYVCQGSQMQILNNTWINQATGTYNWSVIQLENSAPNEPDNVIVAFNNFRDFDGLLTTYHDNWAVSCPTTSKECVDYMNWGQKYILNLAPAQCASFSGDWNASESQPYAYYSSSFTFPNPICFSGSTYVYLVFSSRDVPIGANVDKVVIGYTNPDLDTDMVMTMYEHNGATKSNGTESVLVIATDCPTGDDELTLTPSSAIMENNQMMYVKIRVLDPGGTSYGGMQINGMDVYYTL